MRATKFRLATGLAAAAIAAAATFGLAWLFQDNLARFAINPRTPYQTYAPPPAPDYGARGAWALWPADPADGAADIFYVHSTTYDEPDHWNGPIDDPEAGETLARVAAPNEAGPFLPLGAVYGPRYRQATLYASFTHKYDGLAARELAYDDVARAFQRFLRSRPEQRPIVLVGYGEGALHALGLLQQQFAEDPDLRAQLAAAYLIDVAAPVSLFDDALAAIPPCESPTQTRCVVAYVDLQRGLDEETRRFRSRSLIWVGAGELRPQPRQAHLCVNPLTWRMDDAPAPREAHKGAASATGLQMGETPAPVENAVGAVCEDGVLLVDAPEQSFLQSRHWFGDHWRPQDFNLFYFDLAENAAARVEALSPVLEEEQRTLEPIDDAVDLEDAPVNKAPT